MQGTLSPRSVRSYLYKMDNVLYEIKDQKGILKSAKYDSWKREVINDLASSGYIKEKGNKYVISREGREVIKQDSFLYYNRKVKSKDGDNEEIETELVSIFRSSYMFAVAAFLVMLVVTIFRLK